MESLGIPTPPKGDPIFELKALPDTLKYTYLDEKKIYHVIINSNLSGREEEQLLEVPRKHRAAMAILWMIFKGFLHLFVNIQLILSLMRSPLLIINKD